MSNKVTEIRRVVALLPVVTHEHLEELEEAGLSVEKKYLDVASYVSLPYTQLLKHVGFLQIWVFIQQLLIIYLLYKLS